MVIGCMSYSQQQLIPILKSLGRRKTNMKEISSLSGIPYGTVKDRIYHMHNAGLIRISGPGRRWGFSVEVIDVE